MDVLAFTPGGHPGKRRRPPGDRLHGRPGPPPAPVCGRRLVFSFDSDEAGQRATEKALMTAARNGLRVSRCSILEGGKDPAKFWRPRAPEAIEKTFDLSTINGDDFVVRRARASAGYHRLPKGRGAGVLCPSYQVNLSNT
ncbi:MAG: hypothetical protein MZU95_08435 [Desulfomicrobium escambiense]|nr:hypothetical protein [Desulfomicrobium escambiense]